MMCITVIIVSSPPPPLSLSLPLFLPLSCVASVLAAIGNNPTVFIIICDTIVHVI